MTDERTKENEEGEVKQTLRLAAAVSTVLTARMPKNMKQQKILFSTIERNIRISSFSVGNLSYI